MSDAEGYIFARPRVRITTDHDLEIWRRFLIFGQPHCVCKTPRKNVHINLYYVRFLRTPCGYFGTREIGISAAALSEILEIPRLDTVLSQKVESQHQLARFGPFVVDAAYGQLILQKSGLIYPFNSIVVADDGIIKAKVRGNIVGRIPSSMVVEFERVIHRQSVR